MTVTQFDNVMQADGEASTRWKIEVMLPVYFEDVDHSELDWLMTEEINAAAKTFAAHDEADHDPTWPTSEDFVQIFLVVTDFDKLRRTLAERYCRRFGDHLSKSLGFSLGLEFKKLLDRRPYGASERILATLPAMSLLRLHRLSAATGHENLKYLLSEGYSKGLKYHRDIEVLLETPVQAWDEDELSILIEALADPNIIVPTIDETVVDECRKLDAEQAFKSAVDWTWFARKKDACMRYRDDVLFKAAFEDCSP